jgi:hypothetical protein
MDASLRGMTSLGTDGSRRGGGVSNQLQERLVGVDVRRVRWGYREMGGRRRGVRWGNLLSPKKI